MCGSVRHRDAETTRNKLRTNKSQLQIVGQNLMNGSVGDANFLVQFHDGHLSIILNQLSHFLNQRNSGNVLTALRIYIYIYIYIKTYARTLCAVTEHFIIDITAVNIERWPDHISCHVIWDAELLQNCTNAQNKRKINKPICTTTLKI